MAKKSKQGRGNGNKAFNERLEEIEKRLIDLEAKQVIRAPCPVCKKNGKPTGLMINTYGEPILDGNLCQLLCQSCNGTKEVKNG